MTIPLLCCSGSLDGGGSERQLWQLASKISRPEFCPHLYLHYRRGVFLQRCPADVPIHAFWDDYAASQFVVPGAIHQKQVQHLAEAIKREGIRVVYDRTFHMTLVTGAACRRAGVPRVSVIVSPPSQDFAQAGERFAWLKKRKLRRAYSEPTSRTVAVSQSVAQDAAEFYRLKLDSIEIIPSPIDIAAIKQLAQSETPANPTDRRDSPGPEPEGAIHPVPSRKICVVGRLSGEKGQAHAIGAFAQVAQQDPAWRLEIIGDGPDLADLKHMTKKLGVASRVHFRGFMDNPYPAMEAADLVLIPSQYEGLPNVALEAMALRTPVIATNCSGSVRELLGDETMCNQGLRGQVVGAGDAVQLTQALLAFDATGRLWQSRVELAEQWVLSHHGLQAWLTRMERLFRDTLDAR